MESTRNLRLIRNRLWMIIAFPVLAAAATGAVSRLLPPEYEAHTTIYVRLAQPLMSTNQAGVSLSSDQVLRTYAALATQRPLLQQVINDLGLSTTPDELGKGISVAPVPKTTVLDVGVRNTNPAAARDVANRLTVDLIAKVRQFQQSAAQLVDSAPDDSLFVVSPAILPDKPSSPNIPLNVAMAFAAGLLVALVTVVLLNYRYQTVKKV